MVDRLFFAGTDASNKLGLWSYDGSGASPIEIMVAGSNSGGFGPGPMVVFGGNLYFAGYDSSGRQGLWSSSGTARSR